MKYFLLGAFSTGFLLYGIALVYGATGTIKLGPIHDALASGAIGSNPLLLLGIGMMLIGFGFKVAAVPFHMWTPDVYEGAPTPVTAFMAVGVKLAAFAAFMRVFLVDFASIGVHWQAVLWVVAALTMTGGNIIAVVQTNIKRMLAYSAIAHAGYLLLGMAAGVRSGPAILYYLLGYAFTNLGAFSVIIALERRGETGDQISDFRGLAARQQGGVGGHDLSADRLVRPNMRAGGGRYKVQSPARVVHWMHHAYPSPASEASVGRVASEASRVGDVASERPYQPATSLRPAAWREQCVAGR